MGVNGIYGLSGSGLDIESMVKVGMLGKQNEYDKMQQKYTKNEWTKAAYLELNSNITTFNLSSLSQYKMSSTMNAKSVTSTDTAIRATANANAAVMSHSVTVDSLSSNSYLIGTNKLERNAIVTASGSESSSIKLADVLFDTDPRLDDEGNDNTDYKADTVAFRFTIGDGTDSETIEYTYGQLLGDSQKTFYNFVSDIKKLGLNVKASYDSTQDKFSFINSEGGAANGIQLTFGKLENNDYFLDDADNRAMNFFNDLGLVQSQNGQLVKKNSEGEYEDADFVADAKITFTGGFDDFMGTNGSIVIDGVSYETTDNKITVGDITYEGTAKASATVAVSQDVDGIVDKVKSFVADYNKLLSSLYEKYDEKPNSDYKPLTQSQKDSMKDEQIEKWETKAKAGLLYHDRTIGKIITDMRNAIVTKVEGVDNEKYNSAYTIGISTTGIKGQLTLDEDKLRRALADDPDSVYSVFASMDSTSAETMKNSSTNGIAQRLGDIFVSAKSSIEQRAGSSSDILEDSDLNNLLRQLQTRMSNFKKMMSSFEDALYKKYDAMESTLARLGTQLNYVMGGQQ